MQTGYQESAFEHPVVRSVGRFLRPYVNVARHAARDLRAGSPGGRAVHRVGAENLVWIFGTGRTGSTWLAAMMGELKGHAVWFEPRVGDLFDPQRFERYGGHHFVLSSQYRNTWLTSMRNFVLDGADARFPEVAGPGTYLMIKEPGGSRGATLLMEALPESRMVLLVRDPRDVVASWLDAGKEGGWQSERSKRFGLKKKKAQADKNPDAFVRRLSNAYLRHVGSAKQAYEAHAGRKVVVRYEDLRINALGTMKHMYSALGIPVKEKELVRAVEKHAWENIPEDKKGEGKFYRKAQPGGWREDLTPEQIEMVEETNAPLLEAFRYSRMRRSDTTGA